MKFIRNKELDKVKVFVTGSTGMVGNNLVRLLQQQGHSVRALVRSRQKAAQLIGDVPGVELITGDMDNVKAFAPALEGCDVLMHTAAYFREYAGSADDWQILEKINVKATLQLFEEAEQRGVQKVIYISSSGAIGRKNSDVPGDETDAPDPQMSFRNLYFKSKVIGEEELSRFLKNHKIPVVMVNPSAIMGPGDAGPTAMGKLVQDVTNRKLPGLMAGGLSIVDARDVAQGMINAVERGKSGERYLLSGGFYTFGEICQTVEKVSSVKAPKTTLPFALMLNMARVFQFVSKLTGKPPLATVDNIRFINEKWQWSAAKAQRELGATFRPLEDTVRDTVNWYKNQPATESKQSAEAAVR
jgi:dihydroflavonol-4-reductase